MEAEKTNKDQPAQCPRCKKKFECRPGDISSCDCSKIELSKEEYRYISSKFQICVCNGCLKELKDEYNSRVEFNKKNIFKDGASSLLIFFCLFFLSGLQGQTYAPVVGQPGSTAIEGDSSIFVNWASGCTVTRGYQDISTPSSGYASVGDNTMATGKAQSNGVVSLGDGGFAVCTFNNPIKNGAGYDFAVFENGFDDVFLELAFVEVSSDGVNFFRFHAHSLTDTSTQTGSFGSTDATKINNLAGKYRGGYGTPFDLQELAGTPGLNINAVSHVKVIDVVGSINKSYASRDFYNNKVNDPWPTAFASGGFDLDAIGVINESTITGIKENTNLQSRIIYPNPVNGGDELSIDSPFENVEWIDVTGKIILVTDTKIISTAGIQAGIYCLKINYRNSISLQKIIVR